jgi:hypothetical protein
MVERSKWLAVSCVAALLVFVPGCSDDDDDVIARGQVTSGQAEAVIGGLVVPAVETLISVAEVLAQFTKSAQVTCTNLEGVEAQFFCTPPESGQACPVNLTTTDIVFDNCMSEFDDDIDGVVTVTDSGSSFGASFQNLMINGQDYNGNAVFVFDDCDVITLNNFSISDGATVDMTGSFTICGGVPDGSADGLVTGSAFLPFTLSITVNGPAVQITVIDNETQTPLFLCSYNPLTETAECVEITEPL